MSQHLESLAIGDSIEVKGPLGHVHYLGRGRYTLDGDAHTATHISMIAGGTGITPMYQVGGRFPGPLSLSEHLAPPLRNSQCLAAATHHTAPWMPSAPSLTLLRSLPPPPSSPHSLPPPRQVIKAALKDGDDSTQLALLYANVSPDDILLREELDALAAAHPNFKVWYTGARRGGPGLRLLEGWRAGAWG